MKQGSTDASHVTAPAPDGGGGLQDKGDSHLISIQGHTPASRGNATSSLSNRGECSYLHAYTPSEGWAIGSYLSASFRFQTGPAGPRARYPGTLQ